MTVECVKATVRGRDAEIANYTPHPVTIFAMDGETALATVPKAGVFIRVAEKVTPVSDDGVPLIRVERDPNRIEGLPPEVPGRYLIVSDITYQAAIPLGREDLVRTGPAVRGSDGRIVGCKGLAI